MRFLVEARQNLTACDTYQTGLTDRTLSQHVFDNRDEAEKFFLKAKNMLKFAGLEGQYYTYPRDIPDEFELHKFFCDQCGEGFSNEAYTALDGDFCSKACFRNSYQNRNSYNDEPDYED